MKALGIVDQVAGQIFLQRGDLAMGHLFNFNLIRSAVSYTG